MNDIDQELKILTDMILKLSPEHKEWIMKHWGDLYEDNK